MTRLSVYAYVAMVFYTKFQRYFRFFDNLSKQWRLPARALHLLTEAFIPEDLLVTFAG